MGPAPPRQSVRHASYRGFEIVGTPNENGYLYSAASCALSAASQRALHLRINSRLFRQATGIADPALEELYAGADSDRDGYLCGNEIREVQRRLAVCYEYWHNATALPPDELLTLGGGDCEDWALLSCGLLRYWSWEAYVAALVPTGRRPGYCVPIDYHVVGGSSNAVERGWALRQFYTPERIYGAAM
ncbi:MAG: hypothetical protein JW820_16440 [Spirochaetales bacterium]|nr:hypothetical protein [Spirochaetales bacterium]